MKRRSIKRLVPGAVDLLVCNRTLDVSLCELMMTENRHRLSGTFNLLRFRYNKGEGQCQVPKSRKKANWTKCHRKTERCGEKLSGRLMNVVETHLWFPFSEMTTFWYLENSNNLFRIFCFVLYCSNLWPLVLVLPKTIQSWHYLGAVCDRLVQWLGHFVTVHRIPHWGNVLTIPLLIAPILRNCELLFLHPCWRM